MFVFSIKVIKNETNLSNYKYIIIYNIFVKFNQFSIITNRVLDIINYKLIIVEMKKINFVENFNKKGL